MLNILAEMTVLGINIDNQLNFNKLISNMCNETGRQFNGLQRLKFYLNCSNRLSTYKMLSSPILTTVPWMFTSTLSLSKLEYLQKRAIIFVLDGVK